MYSENFFNIYFHEQLFFQIFVARGNTGQVLRNVIYEQYNFH